MKKEFSAVIQSAVGLAVLALLLAWAGPARAAGPFTVTVTTDSHAASPGTTPNDSGGHISLRSAIEAANAQGGATINVPAGTYNLAFGELDVLTNSGKTITIQASGGNAANTVINQTNGTDRVFNLDPNSLGGDTVTLSGLTIQGGHDARDIAGGAGILAGSITNTPKDVLNLTGCVIANNRCSQPNIYYTAQIGGGVQMAGGDLNLTGCTFSNNASAASSGGAIAFFAQSVASSLNITNSIFVNNAMTNASGSGPDGGGAIFIGSTLNSVHKILNSLFTNNQAICFSGFTCGGAIQINTGSLNISNSTFANNLVTSASGVGGQGGALYVDAGTNSLAFCRLVGNSAPNGGGGLYNHNSNGANTTAVNDWWGCNGGPGASGCDLAATDLGGLAFNPFITLFNVATPGSIRLGQATTLTAFFVSSGSPLTASQASTLAGLPVAWSNAVLGTISNPQTVIQPSGMATATFTAGQTNGTGSANATVDNAVATATIGITCPSITGSISGSGGVICPGGAALVTVAVSGGLSPYSITLNNGGGTMSGASPLHFIVSPANTTTYQVSTGQDAEGCPVSVSGSATVTVNPLPAATISASLSSVLANSSGNQANAPAGAASYAWTINNGFIIGPTNLPAVSYIAGVSGKVTLGLTAANTSGCGASTSLSVPIVTGWCVHTNLTFTNAIPGATTGITFDGTNYWDCSGGGTTGVRVGCYSAAGVFLANYSPGLDFRSIFTSANGRVFARAYNTNIIYQQISPGVFSNSGVSLTGGSLYRQSSVVLNGAGTEYDAMYDGVVSRWNTNGAYLGSVNLQGYGTVSGETAFPQNRGLAAFGNVWLTYNGAGILAAWDYSGNRVWQAALPGAGTSSDSDYSFSCCNSKVFIVDVAGGLWRSYDISSGAAVAVLAAETTVAWTADVTNKISGMGSIPYVDFIRVATGDPMPTPAQLLNYQSVLVFSDYNFNDQQGLGNELADYIDQGGGVVMNTFAFDSGAAFGIQGRLTNSYMAFTTASYAAPASLTLAADLPSDPLLNGVNSFNGGTESFQNSSISIAANATLVAQWSNGQPLVGKKVDGAGRFVGLNFFPPSSDAFSPGWVSSTDGAKLMANALMWSGQFPSTPITIISAPADQVVALGGMATFSVVASGAAPLTYQWQLNGTNLPAATNSGLSFTVQTGNLGEYSVVVSNPFGQAGSVDASLNLPLQFLPPGRSAGNALSLLLAGSSGSLVASNRAARVQLYASSNLALPFSQWLLLTNPVIPSGGLLQVSGLATTNTASLFFRALEIP